MTTGRRAARRAALFVLYQSDVTGQPLASLYEGELDPYTQEVAEGVAAEAQELDATIGEASSAWPPERLGALERNILRIALYELDAEASAEDAEILARVSRGLGDAMSGLSAAALAPEELLETRGW